MKNIRVMRRQKLGLPFASLFLLCVLAAATLSQSVSAAGGNGLRVSPVRTDLVLKPGENKTMSISVTNVTSQPATLQAIVNDFVGNPDESGNPAIILNPNEYAPSHSLKRFISPIGNFTLNPGQAKNIDVTMKIPANAAGGGYFGAVRFAPAGSTSGPNQTVSLAGSVGSLILVKVPGDIKEQVSIASFDVRKNDHASSFYTNSKDLAATVRFQNLGNVQEAPFGKVLLKNRSGKILATYELNNNVPPANVLPDSIRKFPIPLNKKVGGMGQYKLEGNFGYGASGQLLSASTTFYVIPASVIIIFAAAVALLLFLVFGLPRLVRAYNRSVIRRANRASRSGRN